MISRRSILGSMLGSFVISSTPRILIARTVRDIDKATRASRIRRLHRLGRSDLLKFRNVIVLTDGLHLAGTIAKDVSTIHSMTTVAGHTYYTPTISWTMAVLKIETPITVCGSLLVDDEGFQVMDGAFNSIVPMMVGDTLKVTLSISGAWEALDPALLCERLDLPVFTV